MQKREQAYRSALVLVMALATSAGAQNLPHLQVTQPGGFPGRPVMNSITTTSNGVNVSWDGPSGYYQLYLATEVGDAFAPVGSPNLDRNLTITNLGTQGFFKVLGPAAQYAGSESCAACHEDIYNLQANTPHAQAFFASTNGGQDTNAWPLASRTVGFGLPTGFTSLAATPHLANVGCESCHGPAAVHAANEMDLTRRPRIEMAGEVCGGCHTGSHHPTYDEWKSSGHFAVVEDMNPSGRISSCGRCHSGSARMALIAGENPADTVTNDANVGITCVVCHDPHQTHVWTNALTATIETNQLRYALASTNDFFLTTSDNFTNKFNPNINLCAQCHNHRGASWTATGRGPHHSPQYNMLLGTIGVVPDSTGTNFIDSSTNARPASHATRIEKQCVSCHMPKRDYVSEATPAHTGHTFEVETYDACTQCHMFPEMLKDFVAEAVIRPRIQEVKSLLDQWATGPNVPPGIASFGALAWEFSPAGDLSNPSGDDTIRGPSSSQQQQYLPMRIRAARFNLYIVNNDGSLGTHNGLHALALLDSAIIWVQQELNK